MIKCEECRQPPVIGSECSGVSSRSRVTCWLGEAGRRHLEAVQLGEKLTQDPAGRVVGSAVEVAPHGQTVQLVNEHNAGCCLPRPALSFLRLHHLQPPAAPQCPLSASPLPFVPPGHTKCPSPHHTHIHTRSLGRDWEKGGGGGEGLGKRAEGLWQNIDT
jgi:hypothetical protein